MKNITLIVESLQNLAEIMMNAEKSLAKTVELLVTLKSQY